MIGQVALADFKQRVRAYEAVYEELADEEDDGAISYIKVRWSLPGLALSPC